MELIASMIAFFVLVGSWFVLPATSRTIEPAAHPVPEGLPTAA